MNAVAESAKRWVRACTVDEIPPSGGRQVTIDGIDIGVFRTTSGRVFAVVNRCPHRGGPLSEGIVTGDRVVCPLHAWSIELQTGEAVAPDRGCVSRFPVELRAGEVYLDLTRRPKDVVPLEDITGVHRALDRGAEDGACANGAPAKVLEIVRGGATVASLTMDELSERYALRDLPTYVTSLRFDVTRPVTWSGVRLREVLDELAGGAGSAAYVSFRSRDEAARAFERVPIEHAMDPRTMLVVGMNGRPLPDEQGGPVRAVVPFALGEKSVKWLTAIELHDEA